MVYPITIIMINRVVTDLCDLRLPGKQRREKTPAPRLHFGDPGQIVNHCIHLTFKVIKSVNKQQYLKKNSYR